MQYARENSDQHQHICLLWPQIFICLLLDPRTPTVNCILFQMDPLQSIFLLCVSNKIRVNMGLFIPFYPQIGRIGWQGPDITRPSKVNPKSFFCLQKLIPKISYVSIVILSLTFSSWEISFVSIVISLLTFCRGIPKKTSAQGSTWEFSGGPRTDPRFVWVAQSAPAERRVARGDSSSLYLLFFAWVEK